MRKDCVCGIYKITNILNGKKYVGQSTNIIRRWSHHKTNLIKGTHVNLYLQRAVNKYGLKSFSFDVIETVEKSMLDEREAYWIQKLQAAFPNGYNLKPGGDSRGEWCHSEQTKDKLRKPVICLNDLQTYKSVIFAEKATGIEHTMIQHCCLGDCNYARNPNNELTIWAYVCDFEKITDKDKYIKEKLERAYSAKNRVRGNSRAVVRLNDRTIFPTAKMAGISSGLSDGTNVLRVANGTARYAGSNQDGEKYVWRYVSDYEKMTENEICHAIMDVNRRGGGCV